MFNKKRSSKNLRIGTRITISTIVAIVIPLVVVTAFFRLALHSTPSSLNISALNTKSYSILNQIQWGRTAESLSDELLSDDGREKKLSKIREYAEPIEKIGANVLIEYNGKTFYSTSGRESALNKANKIVPIDENRNINYFGENGMVIVNHIIKNDKKNLILISSDDYKVENISKKNSANEYFSFRALGNTTTLIMIIILLFILSIAALSFITSRTIVRPLKKLSVGANEIAKGNLNYKIDYESTNEIGQTVDAFNKMSAQLKHSIDERSALEQSRKEMIAGVAHDLRTPLTSVKGYVEGLRDGIANTPEKRERYINTIYDSTLSMEKLLDELQTISKLELGRIELNPKKVNINDFISDCEKKIRLYLDEHDFELEVINKCSKDDTVMLDTSRFSRVMQNIVSNSVKYARKGVKGKVVFEAQSYESSVILSLSDNGIGVESENLSKIFETFYRADKSRTRVKDGSGLGLAVCRQIVEMHGGHIWATKNEEHGLTILISLRKDGANGQKYINS